MNHDGGDDGADSSGEHPLKLAVDIVDWAHAGRRILKVVQGIGRIVPPFDGGQAAQLSQLIVRADEQLAELGDVWETIIRPRLRKYEGAPVPPLIAL